MSAARQILVCDSLTHAAVLDAAIWYYFVDRDSSKGSQWSGVFAKPGALSDTYGVCWDETQLREVFGDDPLLTIEDEEIDEAGESNWQPLPDAESEPDSIE